MSNLLALCWGDPEPIVPEPTTSTPVARRPKRPRYTNEIPTDILEWLGQNEPEHFGELTELRRALYSRKSHGKYRIRHRGHTMAGEEKFIVKGPTGPLLILSNKSRHFLLRTLCRLRRVRGWPPLT